MDPTDQKLPENGAIMSIKCNNKSNNRIIDMSKDKLIKMGFSKRSTVMSKDISVREIETSMA